MIASQMGTLPASRKMAVLDCLGSAHPHLSTLQAPQNHIKTQPVLALYDILLNKTRNKLGSIAGLRAKSPIAWRLRESREIFWQIKRPIWRKNALMRLPNHLDFCKKKRERLKGGEVGPTSEASVGKRTISVFAPVSDVVMVELSS